jgi:hypothetical protein
MRTWRVTLNGVESGSQASKVQGPGSSEEESREAAAAKLCKRLDTDLTAAKGGAKSRAWHQR